MTRDNWLVVALIISTLLAGMIGPVIGAVVASRLGNAKPTPVARSQKSRIQSVGGWLMRFFQSPWKVTVFVVLPTTLANIYWLLVDLRSTAPVTPKVVFRISMLVGGIVYNMVSVGMLFIWQAMGRHADVTFRQSENISDLVGLCKALQDSVNILFEHIKALTPARTTETVGDTPARGTLRKFLAGIKFLLGD